MIVLSLGYIWILLNRQLNYALLILGIQFIEQFSKLSDLLDFIFVIIDLFEFYGCILDESCYCLLEKANLLDDELDVHLFLELLSVYYNIFLVNFIKIKS